MEIKRSTTHFKQKLWGWKFGKVCEGVLNDTKPVAIKTFESSKMEVRLYFLEEAYIMKYFCKQNENLLELYALCSEGDPIYIVTEPMQNGWLKDYLKEEGKHLTEIQLIAIAEQVVSGMAYLEEQHIIHRDLQSRNVLVGVANKVKIANFGLARMIDKELFAPEDLKRKCAFKWMPLEAITFPHCFNMKCDVWSFGIFLTELMDNGEPPYGKTATNEEILELLKKGERTPCPCNCPPDYKSLKSLYRIMKNCWKETPEERPTFEILKSSVTYKNLTTNEQKIYVNVPKDQTN